MTGVGNIDAVRDELQRIADENEGLLDPQDVVERARDKASPLHSHFTWSNSDAANKQRLHEARKLIRSVRVVTVVNTQTFRTIAYVHDPRKTGRDAGYVSTAKLMTDADLARKVMVAEFERASAAMRRALDVSAALNLASEVGEPLKAIQALKDRVENMTGVAAN